MPGSKLSFDMSEGTHRFWDTVAKFGTGAIAIFVALTGLAQFKLESNKNIETLTIERQKLNVERKKLTWDLTKQQVDVLSTAAEVASTLATSHDNVVLNKAVDSFWKLYWGKLAMVENDEVEADMVELGKLIKNHKPGKSAMSAEEQQNFQLSALRLSHACGEQIKALTDVKGS